VPSGGDEIIGPQVLLSKMLGRRGESAGDAVEEEGNGKIFD
jgi:hypothetical protein